MTPEEAHQKLQNLFQQWSSDVFPKEKGLVGALQFGSTIKKPLKRETDLDLFLVFQDLPKNRIEQFNLTNDLEIQINNDLKGLTDFNIQVSLILKSVNHLDHLSSFYLDFIDTSKIWFDPQGHLHQLMADIKKWIADNGAHKVQRGSLWYWVYSSQSPPQTAVSFKFKK